MPLHGCGPGRAGHDRDTLARTSGTAATRAQLDEAAFAAARSEGRAMSLEQAVAYTVRDEDVTLPTPNARRMRAGLDEDV